MKKTDLNYCKTVARQLLYLDPIETDVDIIVCHPYINSRIMYLPKDKTYTPLDIFKDDNLDKIRDKFSEIINDSKSLAELFMFINKPWKAFYFKMINRDLSEKDFNDYLSYVWIESENPNQDPNVSIPLWISFFNRANKELLMSEEDKKVYDSLPKDDKILIYRGVGKGREPYGLSWTQNVNTAKWFARRWNNPDAYMFKAYCYKKDVLAYFNDREEDELVVNVGNIFDEEKVDLYGEY
jgi:hypothetical protein